MPNEKKLTPLMSFLLELRDIALVDETIEKVVERFENGQPLPL